jgi:hypothetical protein
MPKRIVRPNITELIKRLTYGEQIPAKELLGLCHYTKALEKICDKVLPKIEKEKK